MMQTKCFAALAVAMAAGANAQLAEVAYVDGGRVGALNGPSFNGAPWSGSAGQVTRVPDFLRQGAVRYFPVDPAVGSELRLTPEAENVAAPSRGASALACGRGWAKHPTASTCVSELEGGAGWGWSNAVEPGEDVTVPVFIGASGCEGGKHRFDVRVTYTAGEAGAEVTVDLAPRAGDRVRAASVYVGSTPLPKNRKGDYTSAPGAFPIKVNGGDSSAIKVSEALPGLALGGKLYFAVHANVCPGEEAAPAPAPSTAVSAAVEAPECTTTFFVAVFACGVDPACVSRSTGTVHQDLAAAGFAAYTDSVHFTLGATAGYQHNTRLYVKSLASSDVPLTIPASAYMGVFAAGCGVDAVPRSAPLNVGPVRNQCGAYCPVAN